MQTMCVNKTTEEKNCMKVNLRDDECEGGGREKLFAKIIEI